MSHIIKQGNKMTEKKEVYVTTRFTSSERDEIKAAAKKLDRSVSWIIHKAVKEYLKNDI